MRLRQPFTRLYTNVLPRVLATAMLRFWRDGRSTILTRTIYSKKVALAKNQNTFEKLRREAEKKRKADDKRKNKLIRKETPASPPPPIDRFAEGY